MEKPLTIFGSRQMKLNKEEEALLLENPIGFALYSYLQVRPSATVSECMNITGKARRKTHEMMVFFRPKGNDKGNAKGNAEVLSCKGKGNGLGNAKGNGLGNGNTGDSESRKKDFGLELREYTEGQPNPNNATQYPRDMVSKFYEYWSELDRSGKKMRFEKEKTWELPLRLSRWASNNFDKKSISHPATKKIEKDGY